MSQKHTFNIILTGFMATGKSTVGQKLAKLLDFQFVDTDELIETKQDLSIPDIFKTFGESAFRQMETDIARDLSEQQGLVVATGGRLMLDPVNVDLLSKNGLVYSLIATADEILERLLHDTNNDRPLLSVADPKTKILELLDERSNGYHSFETVSTSGKQPTEIVEELHNLINKKQTFTLQQ